jgi:anti-sigma regulatory factor (Ser/Thr protein kinase)/Fe-S-cluster-containing hydrogenase component 2
MPRGPETGAFELCSPDRFGKRREGVRTRPMTTCSYKIQGGDYEHAGTASRSLKELLKTVGVDSLAVRRVMIAAYEAEMNVVIHATRGTLVANVDARGVHVEVVDEGPGIPDVDLAMTEGYSTAPPQARALGFGAGLGLPNIRRHSDDFAIQSTVSKGTTVRFDVACGCERSAGLPVNSMRLRGELCRQCLQCVHACPTMALRLQRGAPHLLTHLCIECTTCIERCPSRSLDIECTSALVPEHAPLVVPAALLCQFPGFTPSQTAQAISDLLGGDVRSTDASERALADAVLDAANDPCALRPIISPACPAVVALIEVRYPSLLDHLAPFVSPLEAAVRDAPGEVSAVAICPSQRTALVAQGAAPERIFAPQSLCTALMPRLRSGPTLDVAVGPATFAPRARTAGADVLRVTGVRDVMRTLDDLENGLLGGLRVLEPYACELGCFGSGLFFGNSRAVARHRWRTAPLPDSSARAHRREKPREPRSGLRLDPDMARAIAKLGKIDDLWRTLPGRDCGLCGAPNCRAFAEDVVLERVSRRACTAMIPAEEAKP